MKVHVQPNTLAFEGILDEESSPGDLIAAFDKLKQNGIQPPVLVDFSKVLYANSAGIVVWMKFTNYAGVPFKYINAPVWLVNQFNMIKNYFENGSFVETLEAPFFSPKSQDSRVFLLKIGKDVPILEDYTEFKVPNRTADGRNYEIDFNPERYFAFISENFRTFKEKIK